MKFRERNACKFQNLFLKRNAYMFHNKNVENIQSRHRNIFQGENVKLSQENIAKKFQRRYRGKFLNIFQDIIVRKRRRRFHVHLGVEQLETASKCPLLSPIGRLRHVMQRNTFPGHKFLRSYQRKCCCYLYHSNFANHCT